MEVRYAAEIGGGDGYENAIHSHSATAVVRSLNELRSAMENANSGDVIYVAGGAEIDATGVSQLEFGADGVTLASNRTFDNQPGGLIYSNDYATANVNPLIDTSRSDIRISGLRFRGPNASVMEVDNHHDWAATAIGLREGAHNAEIDNCELYAWPGQALNIWSNGARIHHNRIHHCQMEGLGYGMELQYGHHYVLCNLFYKTRHSVAATGRQGNGYTARQNVIGTTNNEYGHALDMHGYPSGGDTAGSKIIIEQNTIMRRPRDSSRPNTEQDGGVHIRGTPQDRCVVRNNWFRHPERPRSTGQRYDAWWQSSVGGVLANMSVGQNHYGISRLPPQGVGAAQGAMTDAGIAFDD